MSFVSESAGSDPPKYKWEIMMSAPDYRGQNKLGYKASGLLADLDSLPGEFNIQVHDYERRVWTTMPISHRKDIREHIRSLICTALAAMKSCGHA